MLFHSHEKLKSEYAQQVAERERQAEIMRKSLQELQERKEGGRLLAPFDGRVQSINRSFQKGNKVAAYETLIVLEDTSSRAIYFVNNSAFGTVPYLSTVELYDKWVPDHQKDFVFQPGSFPLPGYMPKDLSGSYAFAGHNLPLFQ